jgi:RNA-binding protein YhbY
VENIVLWEKDSTVPWIILCCGKKTVQFRGKYCVLEKIVQFCGKYCVVGKRQYSFVENIVFWEKYSIVPWKILCSRKKTIQFRGKYCILEKRQYSSVENGVF